MNIENMNEHQMDDSPVFKPDLTVVYPNKQELYRKENTSPVIMYRRLMVAASFILTAGLVWWLTTEEDLQQQVVAVVPVESIKATKKKESITINTEEHPEAVSVVNKVSVIRKKEARSLAVVSIPEVVSDNTIQKEVISTASIQEEVVSQVVERPRSNFSEEALQSAQLMAQQSSAKATPQEQKAEVFVPMKMQQERKKPFRGLVRKLSRTILGEGESYGEEEGIIRVANLKIPVSQ